MAIIYVTHCTSIKNKSLEQTSKKVYPYELYTGEKIGRFMNRCKVQRVNWAIFSDKYGVWLKNEKHPYYEKHPSTVTPEEFERLVDSSEKKLRRFDVVYFYGNHKSHYFHSLYKKIIKKLMQKGINIKKITHLSDIQAEV